MKYPDVLGKDFKRKEDAYDAHKKLQGYGWRGQ